MPDLTDPLAAAFYLDAGNGEAASSIVSGTEPPLLSDGEFAGPR